MTNVNSSSQNCVIRIWETNPGRKASAELFALSPQARRNRRKDSRSSEAAKPRRVLLYEVFANEPRRATTDRTIQDDHTGQRCKTSKARRSSFTSSEAAPVFTVHQKRLT